MRRPPRFVKNKTYTITCWQEWLDICEEAGTDPWDTYEVGYGLGGGDWTAAEWRGDKPKRED